MARTIKLEGSIKDKFKPLSKAEMDKLRKKAKAKKEKPKVEGCNRWAEDHVGS